MNYLVFTSLLALSNGLPELYSSTGSQLSGEYCPNNVTIICNALEFGNDGILDWFVDDTILARYENMGNNITIPQFVMVESSVLNATVLISSVYDINRKFNFQNFTLTAQLNDLLSIQGQNITCGTILERSNVFSVNNFSILEGIQNVTYLAKYNGIKGELTEIDVQWIDGFKLGKCGIITFYVVQLLNRGREISGKILSTEDCTSSLCSIQFKLPDLSTERYEIRVTAFNQWLNSSFSFFSTIWNTTGNLISIDNCNNTVSITCSTSVNETCSVNSTDSASPVTLKPGEILSLETIPEVINISIHINSTVLIQTLTNNIDNNVNITEAIFISGVAIFAIGSIFLIVFLVVGYVVGFIKFCYSQPKNNGCYCKLIIPFSIIAAIIFTIILILWICFGIFHQDSCLDTSRSQDRISITALVLSIIFVVIPFLLGGLLLVVIVLKNLQNTVEVPFRHYEVQFGTEENSSEGQCDDTICSVCNKPYYHREKNENGIEVVKEELRDQYKCHKCFKSMCENCSKDAYLKWYNENPIEKICRKCHDEYQNEIKEIQDLQQFNKSKPKYSKICQKCDCKRRIAKKKNTCSTCGQWVCNECLKKYDVKVECLEEKRQVCQDCYIIYKMKPHLDEDNSSQ